MRIINNRIIPFGKNFLAINLFGTIFTKGHLSPRVLNHEYIHTLQQRELLFLGFYLWYLGEWLFRLIQYRDPLQAYRNISFEREAYEIDSNLDYPKLRKRYSWWKNL